MSGVCEAGLNLQSANKSTSCNASNRTNHIFTITFSCESNKGNVFDKSIHQLNLIGLVGDFTENTTSSAVNEWQNKRLFAFGREH